jgi:DNA-binding transcriptional ArsR family regulator
MPVMNDGLASLHKVLKDETRRKIVLLLNEKESLSYTDLLNALRNFSTGKLNYHLKILNKLVSKKRRRTVRAHRERCPCVQTGFGVR